MAWVRMYQRHNYIFTTTSSIFFQKDAQKQDACFVFILHFIPDVDEMSSWESESHNFLIVLKC